MPSRILALAHQHQIELCKGFVYGDMEAQNGNTLPFNAFEDSCPPLTNKQVEPRMGVDNGNREAQNYSLGPSRPSRILALRTPVPGRALQGIRLRRHGGAEPQDSGLQCRPGPLPFSHHVPGRAARDSLRRHGGAERRYTGLQFLQGPCPFAHQEAGRAPHGSRQRRQGGTERQDSGLQCLQGSLPSLTKHRSSSSRDSTTET